MTTSTTLSVVGTTTAAFRIWGAEINAQLTAIGLTQTADTGQINWTTVTWPAAINTMAGYEIWRFNDSLQATTPVFIKFEYGTGLGTNYIANFITIGNGSNGSGTLTGLTSTRTQSTGGSAVPGYGPGFVPLSTTTNYTSRFVYSATLGFFGFAWKIGSIGSNGPGASAFIFRSTDNTGAATPTTVNLLTAGNWADSVAPRGIMQCLNYGTGLNYPTAGDGGKFTCHAFATISTYDGTNSRIDPVFYATPALGISVGVGGALLSEIPINSSFSATLVGSTPHTYVQVGCPWYCLSVTLGIQAGYFGVEAYMQAMGAGTLGAVMLWE